MKNIQKIADEIFKAPSDEELFERTLQNAREISGNELQGYLERNDIQKLLKLFPNGAMILYSSLQSIQFRTVAKIADKIIKWKLISKQTDEWSREFKWLKGKWKNKNILKGSDNFNNGAILYEI